MSALVSAIGEISGLVLLNLSLTHMRHGVSAVYKFCLLILGELPGENAEIPRIVSSTAVGRHFRLAFIFGHRNEVATRSYEESVREEQP